MKFIPIDSVRGLEIDQPVFVKYGDNQFGLGKLVKEEKTKAGIERTFELAIFDDHREELRKGMSKNENKDSFGIPYLITHVTHVCIQK